MTLYTSKKTTFQIMGYDKRLKVWFLRVITDLQKGIGFSFQSKDSHLVEQIRDELQHG